MQVMTEREELRQLSDFMQIDAHHSGEPNGGKPGRDSENKQTFVIAVATDTTLEFPAFAIIERGHSFDNASRIDRAQRRLAPKVETFCGRLGCLHRAVERGHGHIVPGTTGGSTDIEAEGARWVNVVLSTVKRAISGYYHAMRQARYARRYLA